MAVRKKRRRLRRRPKVVVERRIAGVEFRIEDVPELAPDADAAVLVSCNDTTVLSVVERTDSSSSIGLSVDHGGATGAVEPGLGSSRAQRQGRLELGIDVSRFVEA